MLRHRHEKNRYSIISAGALWNKFKNDALMLVLLLHIEAEPVIPAIGVMFTGLPLITYCSVRRREATQRHKR